MKRIFHRRTPSSASARSLSPDGSGAEADRSPPKQAPRSTVGATTRSAAHAGGDHAALEDSRRAGHAKSAAEDRERLHAKVVAFVTASDATQQHEALRVIHEQLARDSSAAQDRGDHSELRVPARDVGTLIGVLAQRLRVHFSRALEAHNAGILDGSKHTTLLASSATDEGGLHLMMLQVLQVLLSKRDDAQAVLLVSERLPSTLVKVVKALNDGSEDTAAGESLAKVILAVLARVVSSPEVVQELRESSTLHRIFRLAFRSETQQLAVLKVVNTLVQHVPQENWRSMARHMHEHQNLLQLVQTVNGMHVLAKVTTVTAVILRRASAVGTSCLHEQMRVERQRHQLLVHFVRLFESQQQSMNGDAVESTLMPQFEKCNRDVADAVAELCVSGSEVPLIRDGSQMAKAFALVVPLPGSAEVGLSYFNGEAFGLLADILTYLHGTTKIEEKLSNRRARDAARQKRERLECWFIQKLCQLVVQDRYDYEFVTKTRLLVRIIDQLDDYSEMAQHTVGSVLSAIAIEASVVPYAELAAINAFIGKGSFQDSSVKVLLAFVVNLLRFENAYHEVLRSVGLVSTLVTLFLDQTIIISSENVGSIQIRVEHPTSTFDIGQPSTGVLFEQMRVNERDLLELLTSHCHQRARRRSFSRNAMGRGDFVVLMEAIGLLANGVIRGIVSVEDDYYKRVLCGLPLLECVCILTADEAFQSQALSLWTDILRLSLIFQQNEEELHNVANTLLQSIRYVALAMYFPSDGEVTLALPGNAQVLEGAFTHLAGLLLPAQPRTSASESYRASAGSPHSNCTAEFSAVERDRVCAAVVACDGVLSLLAVLCALTKRWRSAPGVAAEIHDDGSLSSSTVSLAMNLIRVLATSSTAAEESFSRSVTFGYYGDLIQMMLRTLFQGVDAAKASPASVSDNKHCATSLVRFCVMYFINFAVDGQTAMLSKDALGPESLGRYAVHLPGRGNDSSLPGTLRYPQSLAIAVQLLSLWSAKLDPETARVLLSICVRVAGIPGNARSLASSRVLEVILRSFTSVVDGAQDSEVSPMDPQRISQALLSESNAYLGLAVSLVKNIALADICSSEASYWIKLLVYLTRTRSSQSSEPGEHRQSSQGQPSSKAATLTPPSEKSVELPLLRLLADLTSATYDRANGSPVISFDVSKDGFACLQIPDVNVRPASNQPGNPPAAATSSLPSFTNNIKLWPPPEGYSVSMWFRVDALERKEEREKLYRSCFLTNKCIHCRGDLQDECMLKCSHRACRGCIEALLNSGGECVVCNPPTFYLFRFRSGDGKSVTEAFLKGSKMYMRTSSSRASAYQFSHTPITTGKWHHAVFTHSKQRFQASMASCYLDGILQESVKISYPSSITGSQPLSGLMGVPSQARRCSSASWTLGPFYLLDAPISTPVVNAVFSAGPSYDKLFFGAAGNGEIPVTFDHLCVSNMALLDDYMWDPVRSLIDSVETERGARNKLIHRSLTIASAASSAAAAIVQDIKSNASVFARIPSAVPLIHIPIQPERIVVAYSSRTAVGSDMSILPSSKLDGRPTAHLIGGTTMCGARTMADVMFEACGSGCQIAYVLLNEATTTADLELALGLLASLMRGHTSNLISMEQEHGYGIANYLLHQKAALLTTKCLQLLFGIAGIDLEQGDGVTQQQSSRESAIRNLQALQYFILDYSLWEKVAGTDTSKLLFSALYSCLAAGDDAMRERNRAQLQSMSFVRQLLYVLMDVNVSNDLLRIIVDVILVCLTSPNRGSVVEANFADVAGFLASTLSPRFAFATSSTEGEDCVPGKADGKDCDATERQRTEALSSVGQFHIHALASPTGRLCLSPRASNLTHRELRGGIGGSIQPNNGFTAWEVQRPEGIPDGQQKTSVPVNGRMKAHQSKIQDLLLDILLKAVKKHDVKENKERGGDADTLLTSDGTGNATLAAIGVTKSTSGSAGGIGSAASRMQLPSASKLTGFRKVLAPQWMEYFLFPCGETEFSIGITPSTVIAALKLLCVLLEQSRYESFFKKEGYYRLLAQGLPCNHDVFRDAGAGTRFLFQEMWYTLFCALLGTPVDGVPHEIQFDMFYLGKDFELNIQRDRIMNSSIFSVILILLRRYYNDPVALASLSDDNAPNDVPFSPTSEGAKEGHVEKPGSTTRSEEEQRTSSGVPSPGIIEGRDKVYHLEVLDFLHHVFAHMPSLHKLLTSGSEKARQELLEELGRLTCAAARALVLARYRPTQAKVKEALEMKQIPATRYNSAVCRAELAEEAAAVDKEGSDPFLHHPVAARALRLLVTVLMTFLLNSPKGHDVVEDFIDGTTGAASIAPPLHEGLQLRFQSLVVLGLLEQIRERFNDEDVLTNHRAFGPNVREFVKLAVEKMLCWQRPQHGDGCPTVFACCEPVHFSDGPSRLFGLVLFVLAETNVGVVGSSGSGASSLTSTSSTSFSGMLSDKLNKGKKRRQFRQLLGRMNMSRSVELESLASELYSALNTVVLHVCQGRGAEVGDKELEDMLQQVHAHRDVVLGSRNSQDKDFFVCLCRDLLQLLGDASSRLLQEAAVHLWIDLMYFQRAFMVELLTVDIRKSGAPPYSVNLMKNGFDMLLEGSSQNSHQDECMVTQSTSFFKFAKWLELVGPPLKELEVILDRAFIKAVMESKETVHGLWAAYHKKASQQRRVYEKQFDARYAWLVTMEKNYFESLLRAQRDEFRRQLKWRQDRIDRQKFIARQWQLVQRNFLRNYLLVEDEDGADPELEEGAISTTGNSALMIEVARRSTCTLRQPAQSYCWRLDFTEGPYRMRKRLSRMVQTPDASLATSVLESTRDRRSRRGNGVGVTVADNAAEQEVAPCRELHRRFSESDVDRLTAQSVDSSFSAHQQAGNANATGTQQPEKVKAPFATSTSASAVLTPREQLRKGSFETLINKYVRSDRAPWRDSAQTSRLSSHREVGDDHSESENSQDTEVDADDSSKIERSGGTESANVEPSGLLLEEEVVDEKLRPLLVPGDEIIDMFDCLRIDGMDSCPGVFLLCNDHVYIIDNYQRLAQPTTSSQGGSSNEQAARKPQALVVEVPLGSTTMLERRLSLRHLQQLSHDAAMSGATPPARSAAKDAHQCRFWAYEDVTELHKRRYQLRHVALELFAHDGRNYLITLESHQQREDVFHGLLSKCPNVHGAASGLDGVAVGGDLYSQLRKLLRNNMTERWVHGEISNFAYLMHLNTLAGRSYNDLTQYPVFPWVLADYASEELDLMDAAIYRDLAKPMGALHREEEFRARYDDLAESSSASAAEEGSAHPLSSRPFHYGTHYSSAGIALHYLMRLEPFTSHFRRLHGDKFDHADRLFTSVDGAWKSAAGFESAQNGTQDVKELIPEFFYLPGFLENVNDRAFGTSQTGVKVGDVELPPWANGSATEFVRLNRAALESTYVSANLHQWIDLIFGCKQQGPAAVEACNVFYYLTYEGAVDLDAIADVATKRAIVDQITEFGQTPSQLFRTPHPARTAPGGATASSNVLANGSFLSSAAEPLSSSQQAQSGANTTPDASTSSTVGRASGSRQSTRVALASSFLEGGELITRMQTILSSGNTPSATSVGSADATPTSVLEHAAMLQQEPLRQAVVGPLLASHRRSFHDSSQYSSATTGASIHAIAWAGGSVVREEKVVTVGPRCLLIPPHHSEFLAWGFQDRSVKVLSTGSAETGGHGSDAKVVANLELDVAIDVAAISADGRMVVTSSPETPVLRVWRLDAAKRSLASSLAAASASSSASAASSSAAAAAASSLAAASALSSSHRRRTRAAGAGVGSSTRSLTLLSAMSTRTHRQRLTQVHVSRAYSAIVSGCAGGVAVLWDLNRQRFLRRLPSFLDADVTGSRAITAIAMNEETGEIVVAAGDAFGVYDVNGALRVRLDDNALLFHDPAAIQRAGITAVAVTRRESAEWSAEKAVVTGHADGALCVWAYSQADSEDDLPGKHEKRASEAGWRLELQGRHAVHPRSAVTAVALSPDERKLLTGTQDGQLAIWTPRPTEWAAQTMPADAVL